MNQTIFFGSKPSSCCKSTETETVDLSAASNNPNSCCSISSVSQISEEKIREKAYLLWEEAGKPQSDGTEFWIEAEKQLTK